MYPFEDITIFFSLMASHLIAALFLFLFEMVRYFNINPVLSGATANLVVSFFYILTIIYVIYKNRMIVSSMSEDDAAKCDSLVEAWLKYEVRTSLMWIVSSMIFLLYSLLFKFESKWKKIEENLGL